jgi:pimeloyl-ACP methyl ester carboxylesterase
LTQLFVLASNYDLGGVRSPGAARTFRDYFARCRAEYAKLAPDPSQLPVVIKELRAMWRSQPTFTAEQLTAVRVTTTVALGEHDEIIRRDHAEQLARLLPEARFVLLPNVSHFALWQAPAQLAEQVLEFLAAAPSSTTRSEPSAPTRPSAPEPRGARELPVVPDRSAAGAPTHR